MRRHVPALLSWLRLALIPVCFALLARDEIGAFAAAYVLAGLTDVLDGYFARRFDAMSPGGSLLDSTADALFDVSILLWSVWRAPELLQNHAVLIGALAGFYALNVLAGFVKFGRLIAYHTYVGKTMAVSVFAFGFVTVVFGYVPALVYAVAGVFALFCAEALALTLLSRKRLHDVKSVLHVWRLR